MKKLVSLFLAIAMVLACCAALAEAPEGYPEVKEGIDFGGATIYILDYWSGDVGSDAHSDDPTEEQAAQYAYRAWLDETYNCHIVQKQGGDWGSQITEFTNFVAAPDGSYRLYIIEPGSVATAINQGYCEPWNDKVDLTADKWNAQDLAFTTKKGLTYGVYAGEAEPRQCLYFNKKVLEDAGIDWEEIYDKQDAGEWTWDAFVEYLQKLTRDTDGDGLNDVYGIIGDNSDFYIMSVFSNGGAFFTVNEEGKLQPTMDSDVAVEGLNWGKETWATYGAPQPEGANWDWYKNAWKQGYCGFYMYQTYGGFNDNSEMADMADPWGCVAFPIGPKGTTYVHVVSDNITLMPAVYDAETAAALAFIYDMWTNPTPGYDDEFAWVGNKLNYTDDRAVYETYAMLREAEHSAFNMTLALGTNNDIIGSTLLWNLGWDTPASQIEQSMPTWISLCAEYNGD
ncbi:MAG: extracellular solute-binding protein [Clostridia bacterium]|nr:extracellular solute-binding protein [Clostridia bacterium]